MKYFYGLVLLVLFTGCATDDDGEVQCRDTPVTNGSLFIELVNVDGVNLIANDTYIADDITITYGENTISGVVHDDASELANLIAVNIFGEEGDNIFRIQLSDTEEDILNLNLRITTSDGPCPTRITTINTITYNDVLYVPVDFFEDFKITVVKE